MKSHSPETEIAIQAGIAQDPDNPEWTAEEFARFHPDGALGRQLTSSQDSALQI